MCVMLHRCDLPLMIAWIAIGASNALDAQEATKPTKKKFLKDAPTWQLSRGPAATIVVIDRAWAEALKQATIVSTPIGRRVGVVAPGGTPIHALWG